MSLKGLIKGIILEYGYFSPKALYEHKGMLIGLDYLEARSVAKELGFTLLWSITYQVFYVGESDFALSVINGKIPEIWDISQKTLYNLEILYS